MLTISPCVLYLRLLTIDSQLQYLLSVHGDGSPYVFLQTRVLPQLSHEERCASGDALVLFATDTDATRETSMPPRGRPDHNFCSLPPGPSQHHWLPSLCFFYVRNSKFLNC